MFTSTRPRDAIVTPYSPVADAMSGFLKGEPVLVLLAIGLLLTFAQPATAQLGAENTAPAHSFSREYGSGWVCERGYKKSG
ncbi:MAG: hypothetical protein ACE37N_17015, partial [Pseudohongiellaceae bacterium]